MCLTQQNYFNRHLNIYQDWREQGDKDHEKINKTPTISISEQNGTTPASRNVSCIAETNSQREVVVECFAPYDDHR